VWSTARYYYYLILCYGINMYLLLWLCCFVLLYIYVDSCYAVLCCVARRYFVVQVHNLTDHLDVVGFSHSA
jgi:hypothetical protein